MDALHYFAHPFTYPDYRVEDWRHDIALYKVAKLMQEGILIIAPVIHGYPFYKRLPATIGGDYATWARLSAKLLSICDWMYVYQLPGWEASIGVKAEMELADKLNIPLIHIPYIPGEFRECP